MPRPRRLRKTRRTSMGVGTWVVTHKWLSIGLLLLLYIGLEVATIPFGHIAQLETRVPPLTALMQQRIREAEARGRPLTITRNWLPISRIPRHVIGAVIVAEDGAFYNHQGVDWHEIQAAMEQNLSEGRIVRGGSTITQQLAKNLYLSTARSPRRKFKELMIALVLEARLSKRRILELYLNTIEWGRGVFGIQAAARHYFGKSVGKLSRLEAARLAAVIPNPLRHRPNEGSAYVERKARRLLQRMSARGI